jgi:SAM-dependent methyltransferase
MKQNGLRRAKRLIQRWRQTIFGMENRYKTLSTPEIFDKIYSDGAWGRDAQGGPTSGAGSHEENIVGPYVSVLSTLINLNRCHTVVDIGCGDFEVGQQLLPLAGRYLACDISAVILQRNRMKFAAPNLEFRQLNLATDELPSGDIALVRQVLQHLSNSEIQAFVNALHRIEPYRFLVVTEHLPAGRRFTPNLDKRAGPKIRLSLESGVDLDAPPFNLRFIRKEVLLEVPFDIEDREALIRTTLYEMRQ